MTWILENHQFCPDLKPKHSRAWAFCTDWSRRSIQKYLIELFRSTWSMFMRQFYNKLDSISLSLQNMKTYYRWNAVWLFFHIKQLVCWWHPAYTRLKLVSSLQTSVYRPVPKAISNWKVVVDSGRSRNLHELQKTLLIYRNKLIFRFWDDTHPYSNDLYSFICNSFTKYFSFFFHFLPHFSWYITVLKFLPSCDSTGVFT